MWPKYFENDKVIEFRKERTRLHFTVTPYSKELREYAYQQELAYEARKAPERAAARERAIAWITGQNSPKDIKSCECGSEAIGSHSHSSWCQMFVDELNARKKTSQTSYVSK